MASTDAVKFDGTSLPKRDPWEQGTSGTYRGRVEENPWTQDSPSMPLTGWGPWVQGLTGTGTKGGDPGIQAPSGIVPWFGMAMPTGEDPWTQGLSPTTAGLTPVDLWVQGSTSAMVEANKEDPWEQGTFLFSVLARDLLKISMGGNGLF